MIDTSVTLPVSRHRHAEAVVTVSLDDWNAISETLHLLSSPQCEALRSAIRQLGPRKGSERDLVSAGDRPAE